MLKKQKVIILGTLIMMLIIACTGCTTNKKDEAPQSTAVVDSTQAPTQLPTSLPTEAAQESEAYSVVDMVENKVSFEQVPEKIAVLLASDVEILYELGAGDQIVAVGEFCNYPSEALEKEVVTTGAELNVEQLIALEADVLIMGTMAQTKEQVEQLQQAGIQVIITNSTSIEDTYQAISLLGQVAGKEVQATLLIETMKSEFQAIQDKVTEKSEKSIYFEVSALEYGLWTAGKETFMQEIAEMVGIKNAFADVTGWAEISEEQVLERNPDYIVTISMFTKDGLTAAQEILSRKNWAEVTAIQNSKVWSDETEMFTRPGPRLVDAAEALYEFIYEK